MTTVYLIRHGQASFGQQNYDQLSQHGQMQAQVLGQYLGQIITDTPYVVAGSMQRHLHTAELALEQFSAPIIHTDAAWNEFDHQQIFAQYNARFADPQLIKQDITAAENPTAFMTEIFNAAMRRWMDGKFDHQYSESWLGFNQRIELALTNLSEQLLQQQPRHAVVFSSGGVISIVIAKLLQLDWDKTAELIWKISNASMTTLQFVDQKFQLMTMNEYHYLQTEKEKLATWV